MRHRVPAPFGRWVVGTTGAGGGSVVLVDADGDRWTIRRVDDLWSLTDADGEERRGRTAQVLIGLAERSGAKFCPWPPADGA